VCDYDDFAKNIIYKFKTGEKYLFEPLGFLMKDKIEKSGLCVDLLAYVPVTAKVLKKRGYNQSELLARYISKELDLPCHGEFYKTKDSDFQKNITAAERRKNIKGVFKLKGDVKDKNILVIDDVITTGSTLSECARVFKNAGAKNVYGCAFAAVKAKIALY
jgi:competence protein ComFC